MSKLLALDQASRTTGYAIFIDGVLEDCGYFTFDDDDTDIRLVKIRQKIQDFISTYDINEVIFEDIQQQNNVVNNVQTFKVLAEVYGVIAELLTELKIQHSAVLSTVWKSALGIKGAKRQEQKKNAQKYVFDTYGATVAQDTADAICIGTYALLKEKNNKCAWE